MDIVDYTSITGQLSNTQKIAEALFTHYSKFDSICKRNNVYKVHSIGDCYVLIGYNWNIEL